MRLPKVSLPTLMTLFKGVYYMGSQISTLFETWNKSYYAKFEQVEQYMESQNNPKTPKV